MTGYEPTDEDIQLMLKQVVVEEEEAKKYLIKCKGNVFNAICCAMGEEHLMEVEEEEEDIDVAENHVDPKKRISQFRNILNKKDEIFVDVTKKEEDITDEIHDIGFIAFTPDTNKFSKENNRLTLKSFIELVAKPFIETGKVENYKSHTFEEIKENPNILGKKPVSEEEMKEIQEENKKLVEQQKKKEELENELKSLLDTEATSHDGEEMLSDKTNTDDKLLTSDDPKIEIDVNVENVKDTTDIDHVEDINQHNGKDKEENIEIEFEKIKESETDSTTDKATESIKKQLAQFFDDKVEIKPLTGKSNDMVKKWRCTEAAILYRNSFVKSADMLGLLESKLESKKMNNIATKLLINANIIKKNQFYTGNALVVDKWYHFKKSVN